MPSQQARTTASERFTPGHIQALHQAGSMPRCSAHGDHFPSLDFRGICPRSSAAGNWTNVTESGPTDLSQYSSIFNLAGSSSSVGKHVGGDSQWRNAANLDFDSARSHGGIQRGTGSTRKGGDAPASKVVSQVCEQKSQTDAYKSLADILQQHQSR